jgi:hypothetical protein
MTFVILLTFMLGPGNSAHGNRVIRCPDWACVEKIMAHTHESRLLSRLRVFTEENAYLTQFGFTVYPPMLDEWHQ